MLSLLLRAVPVGLVFFGVSRAWGAGECAGTPAAAVLRFEAGELAGAGVDADGYRVVGVQRDAVLQRSWATVERCGHREWARVSLPTTASAASLTAAGKPAGSGVAVNAASPVRMERGPMVVRAGEVVRLWRHEANARLEMGAVCEESGAAGERIRLHPAVPGEYGTAQRQMVGLVRGPADVEME